MSIRSKIWRGLGHMMFSMSSGLMALLGRRGGYQEAKGGLCRVLRTRVNMDEELRHAL